MTRITVPSLVLSAMLSASTFGAPAMAQTPATAPTPAVRPPALSPADCFRTREMENHTVGDAKTLYVNVRPHKVYRFDMAGACLTGKTGNDPLIIKQHGGSDIICRPLDLDIAVRSGTGPGSFSTPCIISGISKLTPEQVAALPSKKRP